MNGEPRMSTMQMGSKRLVETPTVSECQKFQSVGRLFYA